MSASNPSGSSESASADSSGKKDTTVAQLLFRMAALVVGVILLFATIGWFLPREYTVSTSIEIDVPPAEVYPLIGEARLWPKWSPSWDFPAQEKVSHRYFDNPPGVSWKIDGTTGTYGEGKMWFSDRVENQKVEYFVERAYKVFNTIELEPLDDRTRTRLVWTNEATLPRSRWSDGLFYGWAGLVYKPALKGQYDADLARLKEVCESEASQ